MIYRAKESDFIADTKSMISRCMCSEHMLEVSYWKWKTEPPNEFNEEIYVSIWRLGRTGDILTFRERIRWIWHILKTGNPWQDSIILKSRDVTELKQFLNECFPTREQTNTTSQTNS